MNENNVFERWKNYVGKNEPRQTEPTESEYIKEFSNRLKAERKAAKLTQEKLAEKLEIERKTVIHWENPEVRSLPEPYQIKKLAKIFHCDAGYLFGEYEEKDRKISDIREQINLSEAAVKRLRASTRLASGSYDFDTIQMDFIDYFITHCDDMVVEICHKIFSRLEQESCQKDEEYEDIIKAIQAIDDPRQFLGDSPMFYLRDLLKSINKKYAEDGDIELDEDELLLMTEKYYNNFSKEAEKKHDFYISDGMLQLARNFVEDELNALF